MVGVAVVEVGGETVASLAGRASGRLGGGVLPGLGDSGRQAPPGARELSRRLGDAAANAPDVPDRTQSAGQAVMGAAAVPLRLLGDRPLVRHRADSMSGRVRCGPLCRPARADLAGRGDVVADERVGLISQFHLRDVTAVGQHYLVRPWQRLGDVP